MANYYVGDDGEDEFEGDDEDLASIFGEDIIGGDEIIGADNNAALRMKIRQLTTALKGQRVSDTKKVVRNGVRIMRVQVLPLPVTSILTGATETVEASPQRTFRVERLIVPSFCAEYFTITQFAVGQDNQFVATGEVSAQTYSEVAVDSRLQGNTADVGNRVNLSIKNIDGATQVFYGSITGTVLTQG